ncbi:fructosamine kinase family protein [Niveibacterium umoris]|uniref:Fructosamine-3-kinase n=1 Tax=Niveibacterium umoris TaxID=1193620 RepID=A0A840BJW9_9RHOO|nr:fructosamine kinase family protein [Niveibacterium umoris]MBB4012923.1 fructosamine-3-kinase [Niveibacterium umoris]
MELALAVAIEAAIRASTGSRFRISAHQTVSGGSAHQHWSLRGSGAQYFVKTGPTASHAAFAAEIDGLNALASSGVVRTPAVIAAGETPDAAFLILEHLDLRPMRREDGARCATALAALHAIQGTQYGWPRDNYIGASPQSNTPHDDWPTFFAQRRLAPQLAAAARHGHRGELQTHGARVIEKISAFFLDHRAPPSLLHGDLWSGNFAVLDSGEPVLFDPAVHYGDREADFAMSELFGGLPESFYAGYRAAAPLADGYAQRRTLYNFYHVLNHLNLFGPSYWRQAERMARDLSEYLRR